MRRLKGFIIKEFYHILRDFHTVLILFAMPVLQVLIFGFVVSTDIKDIRIAIVDHSKDHITRRITDKILSSGYFIRHSHIDQEKDIESSFRKGEIKEVIIFEPSFSHRLETENTAAIQIIADASDPNMANMIVNYTSGIIGNFMAEENKAMLTQQIIRPEVRMYYNQDLKGVFMFVPGTIAIILILVTTLMTSVSITREKEFGSIEVILVSPLHPFEIIAGKVAPYVGLAFINGCSIIALGYFVFGLPVQGNLILLLAESILYILLALSLGILFSTIAPTQQIAMFLSMFGLMLPTMLLSGFIFPIENMPGILQFISYLMPPRYFITILKNIMIKGAGFGFVWKETLVIAGMTVIFLLISIKKFKIRLN